MIPPDNLLSPVATALLVIDLCWNPNVRLQLVRGFYLLKVLESAQ